MRNATIIDCIFPKVYSKNEEGKDETKTWRNPTDYIQSKLLFQRSRQLIPAQRIPFHSDLYVSPRNDKLTADSKKKAKTKLVDVFRNKKPFHPIKRCIERKEGKLTACFTFMKE